jgi:hypothetical protein
MIVHRTVTVNKTALCICLEVLMTFAVYSFHWSWLRRLDRQALSCNQGRILVGLKIDKPPVASLMEYSSSCADRLQEYLDTVVGDLPPSTTLAWCRESRY